MSSFYMNLWGFVQKHKMRKDAFMFISLIVYGFPLTQAAMTAIETE